MEDGNVDRVLDGDLDKFIRSYLLHIHGQKKDNNLKKIENEIRIIQRELDGIVKKSVIPTPKKEF